MPPQPPIEVAIVNVLEKFPTLQGVPERSLVAIGAKRSDRGCKSDPKGDVAG